MDVNGNLILVEFSRIFKYRVNVSEKFRLVDSSGFFLVLVLSLSSEL